MVWQQSEHVVAVDSDDSWTDDQTHDELRITIDINTSRVESSKLRNLPSMRTNKARPIASRVNNLIAIVFQFSNFNSNSNSNAKSVNDFCSRLCCVAGRVCLLNGSAGAFAKTFYTG